MNYKRLICLTLIFFFLENVCLSQISDLQYSEVEPKESGHIRTDFFHIDDRHMLFLSDKNKQNVTVHLYDSLLNHISRSVLDLGNHKPLVVQLINNIPVLFSTSTNSNNEQELYCHNVSLNGSLSSTLLIAKYKNNGGHITKFKLSKSENSKHIVILVEHPYEKEKHEKLSILHLNQEFKIKAEHLHTLEQLSKNKKTNVPIVANNGSVYILKRYWEKGNKYYLYIQKGKEYMHTELKLRNRKIADIKYALSKDDKLILCGFFTSPVRFNFEGVFSLSFNNSTHPEYKKEAYLNEKIVSSFKHKKEIKENGFGLDHFKAKGLLLDTLGNQYLIADHHSIEKTKDLSLHRSKGLVVVKFTQSGSFIWSNSVLTDQKEMTKYSHWMSKVPFIHDNQLCLFYNNTNNEKTKLVEQLHGSNTLYGLHKVEFNEFGNTQDQPVSGLFTELNEAFAITPKLILQEDQHMYFMAENASKTKFRIMKMGVN